MELLFESFSGHGGLLYSLANSRLGSRLGGWVASGCRLCLQNGNLWTRYGDVRGFVSKLYELDLTEYSYFDKLLRVYFISGLIVSTGSTKYQVPSTGSKGYNSMLSLYFSVLTLHVFTLIRVQ